MNLEKIKTDVKQNFINVESGEFFNLCVEKTKIELKQNFSRLKALYPNLTWETFVKTQKEEISTHNISTDNISAIGVFLNAIDEITP